MPLRIGFDLDGVLADFGRAFRKIDERLFGPGPGLSPGQPERAEEKSEQRRRRDVIWHEIQSSTDFWATLEPTEEGAVRRIHELTMKYRWEVFFITQRPKTEGETVQRQTQHWLVEQGFDLPSVLVLGESRGAAANALQLVYLVDDSAQNCLDVLNQSSAKPILLVPDNDAAMVDSARKLGIGTARSIGECLDILERATIARDQPNLLAKIANMVGWK